MVTIDDIRSARASIDGRIHRTPLVGSHALGERTGSAFYLKVEAFQKTGSFKVRGALNKVRLLSPEERARGLLGVSAGNHAQALAFAAAAAGARCTVVMPEAASAAKVAASRGYGAEVVLHGDFTTLFEKAEEIRSERGLTFVHPFDDPAVIAGQGTVGLELIEELPDPDLVLVPVGGGGLISGVAAAVKALHPGARVVGVEPVGAAAVTAALRAGGPVRLERIDTIADGLSAPAAAETSLAHVRALVDDVVLVTDEEIAEALRFLLERTKLLAEPAGAAGVAAALAGKVRIPPGGRVAAVVSGGNVDLARLRSLLPG